MGHDGDHMALSAADDHAIAEPEATGTGAGPAEVLAWCCSPAARLVARRLLASSHLSGDLADDLVQEAACVVLRRRARGWDRSIDNPAAYAHRLMRNVLADMCRSKSGARGAWADPRLAGVRRDAEGAWMDPLGDIADQGPEPGAQVIAAEAVVGLRRVIGARVLAGGAPAPAACALAFLSLTVHPEAPLPVQAPRPAKDKGDDHLRRWTALWVGCPEPPFPDPGHGDSPALRKRRQRALADLAGELLRSGRLAGLVEADSGRYR